MFISFDSELNLSLLKKIGSVGVMFPFHVINFEL